MRFSVNIPCFGDFADPRAVGRLAATAEEAGWDSGCSSGTTSCTASTATGRSPTRGCCWTAAALSTSRLRLGTLVTPVARRRPQALAKQVATLDVLSGGRVTLGVGLGGPIDDE